GAVGGVRPAAVALFRGRDAAGVVRLPRADRGAADGADCATLAHRATLAAALADDPRRVPAAARTPAASRTGSGVRGDPGRRGRDAGQGTAADRTGAPRSR